MTREEITNKCGIDKDIAEFEDIIDAMRRYAQQEVENALRAASEKGTISQVNNNNWLVDDYYIDKESILTAYKVE